MRKSKVIGDFAEAAVLADQQIHCRQRGWGFAVPLSPNYPADVLVIQPSGPVFIEVKATTHPTRSVHKLSAPEARLAAECGTFGAHYILATVRLRKEGGGVAGKRLAVFSLSYSPVPAVGLRVGPRLRKAPRFLRAEATVRVTPSLGSLPLREATSGRGSAPGSAPRSGGTAGGTIGATTASRAPRGDIQQTVGGSDGQ